MINDLRDAFNAGFRPESYLALLKRLGERAGTQIEFRVAETPVFLPLAVLEQDRKAHV